MRVIFSHIICTASICGVLLTSSSCRVRVSSSAAPQRANNADAAIVDVHFYAWYMDLDALQVRYQKVNAFPVGDDQHEFPPFDVVLTVANRGQVLLNRLTVKVTLTYKVGPLPTDEDFETGDLQAYERWKEKSKWREPEWTKVSKISSVRPGEIRTVRVATVPLDKDWRKYWDKGLWPFRAQIQIFLEPVPDEQDVGNNRLEKEVEIDMLC